ELRVGIGILRIEIRDDARILAVAQPVVIIDAHTVEGFEHLRHHRRNRVCRRLRVSGTQWQAARKRNCARSRETEGEAPSSGLTHENDPPSPPSGAANRRRMRHLTGIVGAYTRMPSSQFCSKAGFWAWPKRRLVQSSMCQEPTLRPLHGTRCLLNTSAE